MEINPAVCHSARSVAENKRLYLRICCGEYFMVRRLLIVLFSLLGSIIVILTSCTFKDRLGEMVFSNGIGFGF